MTETAAEADLATAKEAIRLLLKSGTPAYHSPFVQAGGVTMLLRLGIIEDE